MQHNEDEKAVYIGQLISKEIQGIALEEEEKLFLQGWIVESKENEVIYQRCYNREQRQMVFARLDAVDSEDGLRRVKDQLRNEEKEMNRLRLNQLFKYAVASMLLLAMGTALYLWKSPRKLIDETPLVVDYDPASYKASVELSDGRTFNLQDRDTLVMDSNKLQDGKGNSLGEIQEATFATVITPRGGLYNITLPDGTKVKLNAGSSLRYPTHWNTDKREVTLQGEAYFEVRNKPEQPFIVHTAAQSVEVLGTHFNVCAYPDETLTKTTLLEGSVRVVATKDAQTLMLRPGEQTVLDGLTMEKQVVDIGQELAWLYGKFNFDGKNLYQVADELSRWYDVDIGFKGEIPAVEFFGGTFRDVNMSTILAVLKTYGIDHEMLADRQLVLFSNRQTDEKGGAVPRK